MSRRPAVVLAVASVAIVVAGCAQHDPAQRGAAEPARQHTSHTRAHPVPDPSTGPTKVYNVTAVPARQAGAPTPQRPLSITLQNGHLVPIRPVGTRSDGSLLPPENITIAGWWRSGARIGDPYGAMVIAAHVDSFTQGLGPFSELLSSKRGDHVVVRGADRRQTYAISRIALIPRHDKRAIAAQFSGRGSGRLVLITCAGPYIPAKGGYQNTAVLTAAPVAG